MPASHVIKSRFFKLYMTGTQHYYSTSIIILIDVKLSFSTIMAMECVTTTSATHTGGGFTCIWYHGHI
jgi:hypothetical protein